MANGYFALGKLFTYLDSADPKMLFQKTSAGDKWIDDPESEYYNRYVQGETFLMQEIRKYPSKI